LLPFTAKHAHLFFGRETEVDALVERARVRAVLPVVGPSGAGKSSFVQAGVIPRLASQERWLVLQLRPGAHPFERLASRLVEPEPSAARSGSSRSSDRATMETSDAHRRDDEAHGLAARLQQTPSALSLELRRIADAHGTNVLLFVDQLEELFTHSDVVEEQRAFLLALCTAADHALDPVRVIFTVRDDYLGRLAIAPEIRAALTHVTVLQRLGNDSLERALRRPVAQLGYRFEDDELPREMVASVSGEPVALPLLQFAAQQLWERRAERDKVLTRRAYDDMGGVPGALASHADDVLDGLSGSDLDAARQVLLRLVTVHGTRQTLRRSDLLDGASAGASMVLDRLVEGRLVALRRSREGTRIELAHESLTSHWPTLARWIDDNRDELAFIAEIEQAAQRWQDHERRPDELLQGDALQDAIRAAAGRRDKLRALVREFIEASEQRHRRKRNRTRLAVAAIIATLTVASLALWFQKSEADAQRIHAEHQRVEAESQRAQSEQRHAESLLQGARAAVARGRPLEARGKLRLALEMSDNSAARSTWNQLKADQTAWTYEFTGWVYDVAYTSDGRSILAASSRGGSAQGMHLFDVMSANYTMFRGHVQHVTAVEASPDGKLIASGAANGELLLWDGETSEKIRRLEGHNGIVRRVQFTPDSKTLVSGGFDGVIRMWDVHSGALIRRLAGHTSVIYDMDLDARGRRLATVSADRTLRSWDLETGQGEFVVGLAGGWDVEFIASDALLATQGTDESVRLFDASTGKEQSPLAGTASPNGGALSWHEGRGVLAVGANKRLMLYHPTTRELRLARPTAANIIDVQFAPDGSQLALATTDLRLVVHDLDRGQVPPPPGHVRTTTDVVFFDEGQQIASIGWDGNLGIWATSSGARTNTHHFGGYPQSVAADDQHDEAIIAGTTGVVRWDLRRNIEIDRYGGVGQAKSVAIHPPTGSVAIGASSGKLVVFPDGGPSSRWSLPAHKGHISDLDFSPDGSLLVTAGWDGGVRVWDLSTRRARWVMETKTEMLAARFADDARTVVTGSNDKLVRLWDVQSGELREELEHPALPYGIAFAPQRDLMAVPLGNGEVHLWNYEERRRVGVLSAGRHARAASFNQAGDLLATGSLSGVQLWHVDRRVPVWHATAVPSSPPTVHTQHGWFAFDGSAIQNDQQWRAAVDAQSRLLDQHGTQLCIGSDSLELWSTQTDQRLAKIESRVVALAAGAPGCLVVDEKHRVVLYRWDGTAVSIEQTSPRGVVAWNGEEAIVVNDDEIVVLDATGRQLRRRAIMPGVTAVIAVTHAGGHAIVAATDDGQMIHYEDGAVRTFRGAHKGRAEHLILGPHGTVITGTDRGEIVTWDVRDGTIISERRIHGRINQLFIDQHKLHVATQAGAYHAWDMSSFYVDRCTLLRQVWSEVPTVWRDERNTLQAPPRDHECN